MSIDCNFYKKDYVELLWDFNGGRDLCEIVQQVINYEESYSKRLLTPKELSKVIKLLSKNNTHCRYNNIIGELNTMLENKTDVYFSADW